MTLTRAYGTLTLEGANRVRHLHEDQWETRPDFENTLRQMSADELHVVAAYFNWDVGADYLMPVLLHPQCDRATALLIYWRADPVFGLKYGSRERIANDPAWFLEAWDLMRYIEKRLADPDAFATSQFSYDPTNDRGRDRTLQKRKNRPIPIIAERNGEYIIVGEKPQPDDPPLDVRGSLPPIVFQPILGTHPFFKDGY